MWASLLLTLKNQVVMIFFFAKGQLISKGHFGVFNSSKKQTWKFNFLPYLAYLGRDFSFVFWKNWKHKNFPLKLVDLYSRPFLWPKGQKVSTAIFVAFNSSKNGSNQIHLELSTKKSHHMELCVMIYILNIKSGPQNLRL